MIKYEYRTQLKIVFMGIIFFGLLAGFMGYKAYTNEAGLILNRIIEMSADNATIFYWSICFICAVFVFLAFSSLIHRLASKATFIEIYTDHFIVPKQIFSSEKNIYFKNIRNVTEKNIKGTIVLTFETNDIKAEINNRNFKSKQEFQSASEVLLERCT